MSNTRPFKRTMARVRREQMGVQLRVEPASLAYLGVLGERTCKACGHHECSCRCLHCWRHPCECPPNPIASSANPVVHMRWVGATNDTRCHERGQRLTYHVAEVTCTECQRLLAEPAKPQPEPARPVPQVGDVWATGGGGRYRITHVGNPCIGTGVGGREVAGLNLSLRANGSCSTACKWTLVSRASDAPKPRDWREAESAEEALRLAGFDKGNRMFRWTKPGAPSVIGPSQSIPTYEVVGDGVALRDFGSDFRAAIAYALGQDAEARS